MEIVSPIPETLKSLIAKERAVKEESTSLIYKDITDLWNHLKLLDESMRVISVLSEGIGPKEDDETTVKLFGSRLYNDCYASYSLLLSGFYQVFLMPMRDLLECAFLLELFTADRSMIKEWKTVSKKERLSKFTPRKTINLLKGKSVRFDYLNNTVYPSYEFLCEYGAHPTYKAMITVIGRSHGDWREIHRGPFIDKGLLSSGLNSLARTSAFAARSFANAITIEKLTFEIKNLRQSFFDFHEEWLNHHRDFYVPTEEERKTLY